MKPAIKPQASGKSDIVPLREVERELDRRLRAVQGPGEAPIQRACMSNLVIYCDSAALVEKVSAEVPTIVALHPARVLLLDADPAGEGRDVTASVRVRGRVVDPGRWVCSEQVTLHAPGQAVSRLAFAVRSLLIGDLPTNLWWASIQPPPLAGALLYELAETSQQILYDSIGWTEPARGVAATANWMDQIESGLARGRWRVVSDLNWRRLKYWRRLLAQALDPAVAPGVLESVSEIQVEHGPHAVIQAWELASWLASRLGWRVQAGKVQPGVEITWQFKAARGSPRMRIRRLPDGPSEVRRVRLNCAFNGKPGALNFVVEDERRLAVQPEGIEAAARTVTINPQPIAVLVGRQLSDRERDPVFRESMALAQELARSVLGK